MVVESLAAICDQALQQQSSRASLQPATISLRKRLDKRTQLQAVTPSVNSLCVTLAANDRESSSKAMKTADCSTTGLQSADSVPRGLNRRQARRW